MYIEDMGFWQPHSCFILACIRGMKLPRIIARKTSRVKIYTLDRAREGEREKGSPLE